MVPSRSEDGLVRELRELAALDEREAASYETAILQLGPGADKVGLVAMRDEHRRHAGRLKLLVLTLGGHVESNGEHGCPFVTRGRIALAGVLGDRAVLELMKREEARVTRAYLRAMSAESPARVHDAMEVALREQLGHDACLDEAIAELRGVAG